MNPVALLEGYESVFMPCEGFLGLTRGWSPAGVAGAGAAPLAAGTSEHFLALFLLEKTGLEMANLKHRMKTYFKSCAHHACSRAVNAVF